MRDVERHYDVDVGDGLSLHCVATGSGPPVVLLHGFTGSGGSWEALCGQIGGTYEVISLDMPGHGRSSAPSDPARYSLDRFSVDLALVLDKLSLGKVALLGYSMGGRASLHFALSHGDRLAALILESTSPGISDPTDRVQRLAADSALATTIECDGIPAFVEQWERLPLWESQQALAESMREKLRIQRLANRPGGLANSLRGAGAGATVPVTDQLGSVAMPTLVVAGALDGKYTGLARVLAQSIPGARLDVVPGAGHAVHFENPDALARIISDFLLSVPRAGSRWL